MDIKETNQKTFFIAPDGGLREIPLYLKDDLIAKGWHVVMNPKRTYYPEYDQTLKSHSSYNPEYINAEENDNFLEVEKL